MGFNSAFKGLKLFKKNPGNGRLNNLNNLNDPSPPQCVKTTARYMIIVKQSTVWSG